MKNRIILGVLVFGFVFSSQNLAFAEAEITLPVCAGSTPTVTVLSPNGGEKYSEGQEVEVTWSTCNISSETLMKIDIVSLNGPTAKNKTVVVSTPNDGSEVLMLPTADVWSEIAKDRAFKVRVTKMTGPKVNDLSDGNFSIQERVLHIIDMGNNPVEGTIVVSNDSVTPDVVLLKGKMLYQGNGSITIDALPFNFKTVGGSSVSVITGSATLSIDGGAESEEVVVLTGTSGSVVFDNLSIVLNSGQSFTFTVKADINAINPGSFDNGDKLTLAITQAEMKGIKTTTENGDPVNLFGNSVLKVYSKMPILSGKTQTFRAEGVLLSIVGSTVTSDANSITYNIPLEVTSFGGDYYIGKNLLANNSHIHGKEAIAYLIESHNSHSGVLADTTHTFTMVSGATEEGSAYHIDEDTTARFVMTVVYNNPFSPENTYYRAALKQIKIFTDSDLTTGAINISLPNTTSYKTMSQKANMYWN